MLAQNAKKDGENRPNLLGRKRLKEIASTATENGGLRFATLACKRAKLFKIF
jgi:hypothetical protein